MLIATVMPVTNLQQADAADLSGTRVLIIDDDRALCRLIRDYLEPLGYQVTAAHNGPDGLERGVNEAWSAIVLDVMLPGMNGFEVLKRLRAKTNVPVLMLTARGDEADRIAGLEVGADDYLPKTFSTRELLARLRAVTRRAVPAAAAKPEDKGGAEIVVGPLRLNPGTRRAVVGDKPLDLTALEFDLLACLARSRGRVKSREELVEAVAERNYDVYDRSVDVHVWSLRKKLGDDPKNPRFIRTFRSVGYMLINPDFE
jgi:DNA-binding response OmpR family regulator